MPQRTGASASWAWLGAHLKQASPATNWARTSFCRVKPFNPRESLATIEQAIANAVGLTGR